jgi:hypothetical protein
MAIGKGRDPVVQHLRPLLLKLSEDAVHDVRTRALADV